MKDKILNSLKKNAKGIALMLASSLFVCFGQLFWKLSADGSLVYLLVGFLLYGCGAVLMLVSYKFGKLSVLQPMLSANYIISIIVAYFILGEEIGLNKLIGITAIFVGIFFIGGGDE